MKKLMFTLFALLTLAVSASAMSYEQARQEALFLTDKMAYELNLTDAQYEAAYEINLDYLMGVTSRADVFGTYWERRNLDLSYILYRWQWDVFCEATYFYRPLYWDAGYWHFGIYARYPRRDYFYFGRPHFYATYRGGHSWRTNGGRSFYEGRRHNYVTQGNTRDRHVGMRDGWDRGDYRGHGSSSTRVTGGNRHGDNNGSGFGRNNGGNRSSDGNYNNGNNGNRGGSNYGNGNRGGNRSEGSTMRGGGGSRSLDSHSVTGSRPVGTSTGTMRSNRATERVGSMQPSSQRSLSTGTQRSVSSMSGASRSAGSSQRSMGSMSGASRSTGSSSMGGGSRSGGSSHGGSRGGSFGGNRSQH